MSKRKPRFKAYNNMPICLRLEREYGTNNKKIREERQTWSSTRWLERAESMALNEPFCVPNPTSFYMRKYNRRTQIYYIRQTRNSFKRYKRLKKLENENDAVQLVRVELPERLKNLVEI